MPKKVLVTEPLAEQGLEILRQQTEAEVRLKLKPPELKAIIGDYEALVVRSETKVTADIIEAGKKLLVVGRAGVGVDNIDVEAATRCGVVVVNAPTGNTISAAEHTIAMMLALARHIPQAHAKLKSGVWQRSDFMGTEVRGKLLGIIGLGRVGSEVARRAQGMGMRIIAHDPYVSPDYARNLGVELTSVEEVLRRSDFVTLHMPLTSAAKSFIGANELGMMKTGARLINCARGGLVDEEALYQAVEQGKLAGAAADVFSQEPAKDNILFKSDHIIVTPHLAASTDEAQVGVAIDVAEQVVAVLGGQPARYAVNAPLIPPETMAVIAPFMGVAYKVGKLVTQLIEGQLQSIRINYEGTIADCDITALRASTLRGLLESVSEERVNIINASLIAQSRGLKILEQKSVQCQNYAGLITVEATTSAGGTTVAGTVLRDEVHIVKVNNYWLDLVPTGGYFMFCDHLDRPGLIGAVGMLTGKADINISSMQVSRLKARGPALMVLALDEPLPETYRQQLLATPDIYTAKVVKL
jgi:D-3-phosphoglycerate dehydrogenase